MDESVAPRRRILLVIGSLALGGGAENVAAALVNRLAARGHELHTLTFYRSEREHAVAGRVFCLDERKAGGTFAKIRKLISRTRAIRKLWRRERIDLTIAFMEEANFCALSAKLSGIASPPVVVSVRNNPRRKSRGYRALMRRLYPHADRVVSVSREIEGMLRRDFGLDNVRTLYNPVDEAGLARRSAEPLPDLPCRIEARKPLFLTVGRLVRQKGQWHLIRAFQRVVGRNPGAALLVLGEGEKREALEALVAACGLSEHVHFLGHRSNVAPFLRASDGFVLSSLWEGLPMALLEALALNTRVIATDCPSGPREILAPELPMGEEATYPYRGTWGTLIAPCSGEECFESMERVPLTPQEETLAREMERVGELSRSEGLPSPFRTEVVVDQWESLIHSVMESPGRRSFRQAGYSSASKAPGQSPNQS